MVEHIKRQLAAQGIAPPKGQKPAKVQRSPLPAPKEPREPQASLKSQEITFPGKVPGLNGAGGLLRMHWRKKLDLQNSYSRQVWALQLRRCSGPVRLELIRYSTGRPMDYDNLVSTGKLLIDALVRCQLIADDNPQVILERSYTQVRCKPDEQRTVIRLTPLQA